MKKYIALIVVVIALGGGAFFSQQWFVESFTTKNSTQSFTSDSVTFTATTTGTVLQAMRTLEEEGTLSFSGRNFPGLGFFVEEISRKQNEHGYYWILYVNGNVSNLGASSARVIPGDIVEWRYEEGH